MYSVMRLISWMIMFCGKAGGHWTDDWAQFFQLSSERSVPKYDFFVL